MKTEFDDSMENCNEAQIVGGGAEAVIVSSQPPQQPIPMAQIQQQQPPQQQPTGYQGHHKQDCTIWMGDLNTDWDANFIREAFGKYSQDVTNVKMVTTDHGMTKATYCFVEFRDEESARNAILDVNGKKFANDQTGYARFNLAFANSPNQMQVEYNLFVNNLSPDVDDVALFRLFGERYRSCRGAKVYRDEEGRSKEQGFVRFISETDQQRALVEMNKQPFQGRELFLKLARPKTRGTGRYGQGRGGGMGGGGHSHMGGYGQHPPGMMVGQYPAPVQMIPGPGGVQYMPAGMMPGAPIAVATPYGTQLAPNHGMAGFGGGVPQQFAGQPFIVSGSPFQQAPYMQPHQMQFQQPHVFHPGSMNMMPQIPTMPFPHHHSVAPAPHHQFTPQKPPPPVVPVYEDVEPLTAEEHNAMLINSNNEFSASLEASRWGSTAFPTDTRKKELQNILN